MSEPRPIVKSGIMTEFGELLDDPKQLMDEMGMNRDITYVPGFSDMRRAADLTRAENARGGTPQRVEPLPINLRWARRTHANGTPTTDRTVAHVRKGYQPVTKDDLAAKPAWLTSLPAGASVLADGTIVMADMQLMKCSQRVAARNEAGKALRWAEQITASQEDAIQLATASKKVRGSTVEVTKEVGSPIQ
jgi:hypothetical protein